MTGTNRRGEPCGACSRLSRPCGRCRGAKSAAATVTALLDSIDPVHIDDRAITMAEVSGVATADASGYRAAIAVGANHDDTVTAHAQGINLSSYAAGRAAGIGHDEMLSAQIFGSAEDHIDARLAGASREEVDEARIAGADLAVFGYFRNAGASQKSAIREATKS